MQVVEAALYLLRENDKIGTTLLVHHTGKSFEWKLNKANMKLVNLGSKGMCLQEPNSQRVFMIM